MMINDDDGGAGDDGVDDDGGDGDGDDNKADGHDEYLSMVVINDHKHDPEWCWWWWWRLRTESQESNCFKCKSVVAMNSSCAVLDS